MQIYTHTLWGVGSHLEAETEADVGMGNGRRVFGLFHGFSHSWLQLFHIWVQGDQSSANLTEFLHESIMGYEILCLGGCCFNASSSPVPHGDYGTVTASWTPEWEWPDRWNLTLCPLHEIGALETGGRWACWFPVRHVENYLRVLWSFFFLCVCVCVCVYVFISSLRVSYVWFNHIHLNSSPSIFPIHPTVLLKQNQTKPSRWICAAPDLLVCEIFHCNVVSLPGATLREKTGPFFLSSYQLPRLSSIGLWLCAQIPLHSGICSVSSLCEFRVCYH